MNSGLAVSRNPVLWCVLLTLAEACSVERHAGGSASGGAAGGGVAGGSARGGTAGVHSQGGNAGEAAGGAAGSGGADETNGGAGASGAGAEAGGAGLGGAGGEAGAEGCGDGKLLALESCDDGNTDANDGCSPECALETGFSCAGTPSVCKAICGDASVVGREPCDDGNTNDTDSCTNQCTCGPGLTGDRCQLSRFVFLSPTSGSPPAIAWGTNADGSVVTGERSGHAFVWTQAAGIKSLVNGGQISASCGYSTSADGSVIVGGYTGNDGQSAFRWTQASGVMSIATGGVPNEQANSVSGDGAVIVGTTKRFVSGGGPFRWTSASGMVALPAPSGGTTRAANKISTNGMVTVGTGTLSSKTVGLVWNGSAVPQTIPFPVDTEGSDALAVSSDGSQAFGFFQLIGPGGPIFDWTSAGGPVIHSLPAIAWNVQDVSGDGSVVLANSGPESGPFVWQATGGQQFLNAILKAQGVDLTGWSLVAHAISDDGNVIVGSASQASGPNVAFLARWR